MPIVRCPKERRSQPLLLFPESSLPGFHLQHYSKPHEEFHFLKTDTKEDELQGRSDSG